MKIAKKIQMVTQGLECSAALLLLFKFRFSEIFHFIWKVVNFQPISFRIFNFNTILIPKLTKYFHPYTFLRLH